MSKWIKVCPDHPFSVLYGTNKSICRACEEIGAPNNGVVSKPKFYPNWEEHHPSRWLRQTRRAQADHHRQMEELRRRQASRSDEISQERANNAAFARLKQAQGHQDFPESENPPDIAYRQMIARNPAGYDNRFCQSRNCNAMVPRGSNYCTACQERGDMGDEMGLTPEGNYTTGRNY